MAGSRPLMLLRVFPSNNPGLSEETQTIVRLSEATFPNLVSSHLHLKGRLTSCLGTINLQKAKEDQREDRFYGLIIGLSFDHIHASSSLTAVKELPRILRLMERSTDLQDLIA
jgi:hypothetical protein